MKKLPDHIRPDVNVLFVGINPGTRSAEVGHHFAGYSNRFWKLLYDAEFVPLPLTYEDDWRLPEWGFGLTNIVSRVTPGIQTLTKEDYRKGKRQLVGKIRQFRPQIVALLGVTMYAVLFPPNQPHFTVRRSEDFQKAGLVCYLKFLKGQTCLSSPIQVVEMPIIRIVRWSRYLRNCTA